MVVAGRGVRAGQRATHFAHLRSRYRLVRLRGVRYLGAILPGRAGGDYHVRINDGGLTLGWLEPHPLRQGPAWASYQNALSPPLAVEVAPRAQLPRPGLNEAPTVTWDQLVAAQLRADASYWEAYS